MNRKIWTSLIPSEMGDEEQLYLQTVASRILVTSLLISGILIVIGLMNRFPSTVITSGIGFISSLMMLRLTRQGHFMVFRLLSPFLAFLLATFMLITNNGLHDSAVFLYPLIMTLAGLLLGKRGIIIYGLLILGSIMLIGYAEMNGWIITPISTFLSSIKILFILILMSFTAILLYVTIEYLTQSLERVHRLNEQLQRANEAAEAANKAKSLFLANMSHELRTPLNAIIGFSQLMNESQTLPQKYREYTEIIAKSGDHLLTLITDILAMANLETDRMTLHVHNVDLYHLVDDMADMYRRQAEEKGVRFIVERSPNVPHYICTDGVKLRQVLMNVLSNAMKFTE